MHIVVYPHLMTIGGSQINAIELAAAVRDRGHFVTIFAADRGPLCEMVEQLRLPLAIAPRYRRRPSLRISRALRALCQSEKIDIVHGYEWPPCVEAFYGPLLADHVAVGCTVMSMAVAPFIPRVVPLIVGTEQIAAAARTNRSGPVQVIVPPVDTRLNHPDIDGSSFRARFDLEHRIALVLVSRLAHALKVEGIERTMRAAALLAPTTDIRLVIVGDGPARNQLERLAAELNASAPHHFITLTGELSDPRAAYAAGDILLGMGGSALRAMAFAKPVVVLGELGFAELLTPKSIDTFIWQGFYGLGSGNHDATPLAELLRPLISSHARRHELGLFARQLVDSRFSLVSAAERQEEFYRQWLSQRPSRAAIASEAGRTTVRLLSHKVKTRVDRWMGRQASEEFNAVSEIVKTAALADKHR